MLGRKLPRSALGQCGFRCLSAVSVRMPVPGPSVGSSWHCSGAAVACFPHGGMGHLRRDAWLQRGRLGPRDGAGLGRRGRGVHGLVRAGVGLRGPASEAGTGEGPQCSRNLVHMVGGTERGRSLRQDQGRGGAPSWGRVSGAGRAVVWAWSGWARGRGPAHGLG